MPSYEAQISFQSIYGTKHQSTHVYLDISDLNREITAWYNHILPNERKTFKWIITAIDDYYQVKTYQGTDIELEAFIENRV